MDQIRIGKFIANMRKQKNMTQMNLAEQLGVSDKTVSKWETGKSLPDITYITRLCEALEINVNELLAGEKLSDHNYSEKAEETIMELMKKSEQGRKGVLIQTVMGIVVIGMAIIFMLVLVSGGLKYILHTSVHFFDMASVVFLILISIGFVLISGKRDYPSVLTILNEILIPIGVAEFLIQAIITLWKSDGFENMVVNMAVSAISILYAICAKLVVVVLLRRRENKQNK